MAILHGLKKVNIGAFGIAIMLYCLVASGAFGIEEIIPLVGPGMTLILLAVFPFIWGHPISSLVAECNALMPAEGGVQTWARAALGEFWGYQVGWWQSSQPISQAENTLHWQPAMQTSCLVWMQPVRFW